MGVPEQQPDDRLLEAISLTDWETREVYAHFGLAIYFCQVLEHDLVNYVAWLNRLEAGRPMDPTHVDSLFDRLFGSTLGRNLKELESLLGEDHELVQILKPALKLRNALVHDWMRIRSLDWGTHAKRAKMVEDFDAAREELEAAIDQIDARITKLNDAHGITPLVAQEFERLTQLSDSDEPHEVDRLGPGA